MDQTLKQALAQQSLAFRTIGPNNVGAWIMQEFISRNGIEFQGKPKPSQYMPGWPRQCFANTAKLVKRVRKRKLRYFEGYAINEEIFWPFHHAWAVNENNEVVDITLTNPEKYSYLGVHIPPDVYESRAKTSTSVMDTQHGIAVELILKLDPTIIELIPKEFYDWFKINKKY